jgi:hypothetical protein
LNVCLDDFCKMYKSSQNSRLLPSVKSRNREVYLSLSEILLIEIAFNFSPYKNFKCYYLHGIMGGHRDKFGKLPSYQLFVALKKQLFMPLTVLLHSLSGEETGIYFADATSLRVCRNKRIYRHKVFDGLAARGKTTMGWFLGLKLHIAINHKGQIMAVKLTPGNTSDSSVFADLMKGLLGTCYADKAYIGKKLFAKLWKNGLHLVVGIRSNMKNYLMPFIDKVLLRKRYLIETVFGILKTDMNLEHSRHRSPINAFINIRACVVAYAMQN